MFDAEIGLGAVAALHVDASLLLGQGYLASFPSVHVVCVVGNTLRSCALFRGAYTVPGDGRVARPLMHSRQTLTLLRAETLSLRSWYVQLARPRDR